MEDLSHLCARVGFLLPTLLHEVIHSLPRLISSLSYHWRRRCLASFFIPWDWTASQSRDLLILQLNWGNEININPKKYINKFWTNSETIQSLESWSDDEKWKCNIWSNKNRSNKNEVFLGMQCFGINFHWVLSIPEPADWGSMKLKTDQASSYAWKIEVQFEIVKLFVRWSADYFSISILKTRFKFQVHLLGSLK